jgi:hypothetical protein
MVQNPNDGIIYGRAIGFAYAIDRDDATPADIALRNWKKKWPHDIRVRKPEFVNGTLANGVSLNDLMRDLYWLAFASTIRDHERGKGKTDPRRTFTRQAAVELSSAGTTWLNDRLDKSLARYGRLPIADLAKLDWPE